MSKTSVDPIQELANHIKALLTSTNNDFETSVDGPQQPAGNRSQGPRRQSMAARRATNESLPTRLGLSDVEALASDFSVQKSVSKKDHPSATDIRKANIRRPAEPHIRNGLQGLRGTIEELRATGLSDVLINSVIQYATELQHGIEKLRAAEKSILTEVGRRRIESTRQVGLANRKTAIRKRTEKEEAEVMFAKMRRRYPHHSKKHQLSVASANLGISVSTLKRRLKSD